MDVLEMDTAQNPIRIIIDETCDADRKTKSKWTQALRYAWRYRSKWEKLADFFRRRGGIAGCASLFTHVRPSRHRTRRYRGPGCRPCTPVEIARSEKMRIEGEAQAASRHPQKLNGFSIKVSAGNPHRRVRYISTRSSVRLRRMP